jgi:anthranilate phosphoribosyltransferase
VTVFEDGAMSERVVHPRDFGMEPSPLTALAGGDASANAAIVLAVLRGDDHPALAAVALNAAAALAVVRGGDLRDCATEARDAIASGRALATLEAWRQSAKRAKEAT